MKILLSIKPEYVEKIMTGEKKYEYRHFLASEKVESIVIYETSPTKMIVGEVKVTNVLKAAPSILWRNTRLNAGISYNKYKEYFMGREKAMAYELGDVERFDVPISLSEYGITSAPQSFVYIR